MDNMDNNEAYLNPEAYQAKLDRINELENAQNLNDNTDEDESQGPDTTGSPDPELTSNALASLGSESSDEEAGLFGGNGMLLGDAKGAGRALKEKAIGMGQKGKRAINGVRNFAQHPLHGLNMAAGKGYKRFKAVAPIAAGKALRAGVGLTGAALAGVVGAALTDDAEKAISMAAVGAGAGYALSGKAFKSQPTMKEALGAVKYGSVQDYRNAKSDKQYIKSAAHREEYEKYFKEKMTKQSYDKAVREYREAGITDTKTIRNALKLEEKYKKEKPGEKNEDIRGKVQNIVQTYDMADKKAVYGDDTAREKALQNVERQLSSGDAKQKRAIANEIMQGWVDWYNI